MRLHEEYIQRHRLAVPVIRYDSRSNLFLRTKDTPFRWSVFNIVWRTQSGRPGYFEFLRMEPIYNGEGAFRCTDKGQCVYWDQYEHEITKVVKQYQEAEYLPIPNRDRGLIAWEFFLYMYDGWLAERMGGLFFEYVQRSTTQSLDLNTRTTAYRNASRILSDCPGAEKIVEMLNYQIMPMMNGHSQWLEDLVNA